MLRAHTARCVPCAQFQTEAVAITHKLRLAPLEPLPAPDRAAPAPPRRRPAAAGRRRSRRRRARGRASEHCSRPRRSRSSSPHPSRRLPRRSSRLPTSTRLRACRSTRRSHSGRASGSIRAAPTSRHLGVRPVALLLVVLSAAFAVVGRRRRLGSHGDALDPRHLHRDRGGRFNDVERWVLLSSNECYLRRLRDQKTSLTLEPELQRRPLAGDRGSCDREGRRSGTEVRDSCDDVAEELPPDAPADWLHSLNCNDPLLVRRGGRATWSNGVLRVQGPAVAVAKKAVCTAAGAERRAEREDRSARGARAEARSGAQLRIAVGSAKPATGNVPRRGRTASTSRSRTTATARSTSASTRSSGAGRSPSRVSELHARRNVRPPGRTMEVRCIRLSHHSAEHSTTPTALRPGWNDRGSPVPVGRDEPGSDRLRRLAGRLTGIFSRTSQAHASHHTSDNTCTDTVH